MFSFVFLWHGGDTVAMITSFLLSSQLALNNKSQIFPLIMKEKFAMKEYFSFLLNKNLKLYPEATCRAEPKLSDVLSCQMNVTPSKWSNRYVAFHLEDRFFFSQL